MPRVHRTCQVHVGRSHQPHVDVDGPARTEPHHPAFLQHAQQLHLQRHRQVAHLRLRVVEDPRLRDTEPRWSSGANRARRYHDLATTLLAAGGNAIGLGAAWSIYPLRIAASVGFFWTAVGLALLSLAVLLVTPRWSYRAGGRAS